VQQILKNGIDCLEDGEDEAPISSEILELIAEAQEFTLNDDTANALAILQIITETCIENWDDVADFGCRLEKTATATPINSLPATASMLGGRIPTRITPSTDSRTTATPNWERRILVAEQFY
jgi:hypothetical protein